MTSEIDKLKHFHIEDYSGIYFTDDLNDGKVIRESNICKHAINNIPKRRK